VIKPITIWDNGWNFLIKSHKRCDCVQHNDVLNNFYCNLFKMIWHYNSHFNNNFSSYGLVIKVTWNSFFQHEFFSSYLYMFHTCFRCMMSMHKKYEPMKKPISHKFSYQVVLGSLWWYYDSNLVINLIINIKFSFNVWSTHLLI